MPKAIANSSYKSFSTVFIMPSSVLVSVLPTRDLASFSRNRVLISLSYLPNQLSGGQQQRVSIGRALINNPVLMLADEPTGNLDSKNSQEIVSLLTMFNKTYKQTLLVITHDERIALQANRIISIEDGRIARDEVIRS
jgi:ABC-type lipoprotein export system ATPase subunit